MNHDIKLDLLKEIEIPEDGTISRTIHNDSHMKVVIFGFSKGQELSEHTASMPAVLQFLSGDTKLTLGEESFQVGPGAWVHMEPNLAHSVSALTDVVMVLTLIKDRTPKA